MTTMAKAETTALAIQAESDFSLVNRWIKDAQVSPSSVLAYEKGIRNLQKFFASNGITTPTREVMIQYREYLGEKIYDEKGNAKDRYSPATRNLYLTAAKLFMGFLHREGYLPTNPAEHLKGYKITEGHKKSALLASDVQVIASNFNVSTLKGKRDLGLFALMSSCGLRCVEVQRADIKDFETVGSVIRLHVQGKGRDDKTESVIVPAGVYQLIRNWLDARTEVAEVSDDAPLFCSLSRNNFNGRLTTTSISRICKTAMRAAGKKYDSPRLSAHSLRHTAATAALNAGATLREVQQTLRHKRISTSEIYLHELDALKNSATARAASSFGF